jgi:hypothetical protein
MKNIHILQQTDKPSRLHEYDFLSPMGLSKEPLQWRLGRNIYITNDAEIKEGDYALALDTNIVFNVSKSDLKAIKKFPHLYKKIILTTDQDLIKYGVQAIDDEFLEWFVKNPNYEFVNLKKIVNNAINTDSDIPTIPWVFYEIIIPKEETKQETLNIMEKELKSVITPDGELKVLNGFVCETENRKISFALLEDDSIVINARRFEESEKEPYTKEITNQVMRLSKLTVALLIGCLLKANVDFEIDADSIIADLNKKNQE